MSDIGQARAGESEEHAALREGVRAVVSKFDDEYWLTRDDDGKFPFEFHRAMAENLNEKDSLAISVGCDSVGLPQLTESR